MTPYLFDALYSDGDFTASERPLGQHIETQASYSLYEHHKVRDFVMAVGARAFVGVTTLGPYVPELEAPHPFPLGAPVTAPVSLAPATTGGVTVHDDGGRFRQHASSTQSDGRRAPESPIPRAYASYAASSEPPTPASYSSIYAASSAPLFQGT